MACDSPYIVRSGTGPVPVPCGRCVPCKTRRVSQWVFRMLEEEKVSTSAHFVTLTYSTENVPISPNGFMTLDKTHLQKFFKRLRKLCPNAKIKYYAVGEYGTKNKRPHYHAIIYNVTDSSHYFQAWTLKGKPIGSVHVGSVSNNSIAYTMKYIDVPHWVKRHARDDRQKQFPLMSKGIGKDYINDQTKNYHSDLRKNYVTHVGGVRVPMPKYYRDKILTDDQKISQRLIIENSVSNKLVRDYEDYLRSDTGKSGFPYDEYMESCRRGRQQRFYNNKKTRDV